MYASGSTRVDHLTGLRVEIDENLRDSSVELRADFNHKHRVHHPSRLDLLRSRARLERRIDLPHFLPSRKPLIAAANTIKIKAPANISLEPTALFVILNWAEAQHAAP
jgi:hypothetical protein